MAMDMTYDWGQGRQFTRTHHRKKAGVRNMMIDDDGDYDDGDYDNDDDDADDDGDNYS